VNHTTRQTASILGIYAGLLGVVHGLFEVAQGATAPHGLGISAIGAPCQSSLVWHACLPAMTIVPNFLITGILAIAFSAAAIAWAAQFVASKHGGLILILLSILMLLVGAGIIPPLTGVIAGAAATRINAPLTFVRTRLSGQVSSLLAPIWLWALIVFLTWSVAVWGVGYVANQIMTNLSCLSLVLDLALPGLIALSGLARDSSRAEQALPDRPSMTARTG